MRIIAVKTLKLFAKREKAAEQPLFAWYAEACKAKWKNHNELKEKKRLNSPYLHGMQKPVRQNGKTIMN